MKDASETHSSLEDEFDVVHVSPSNRAFQTDTIKPIGFKTSARHVPHRQSRPLPKITAQFLATAVIETWRVAFPPRTIARYISKRERCPLPVPAAPLPGTTLASRLKGASENRRKSVSTPEQRHRAVLAEIREASRIFRARNNTERKFQADDVQPRDLIAPWSVAYVPPSGES